MSGESKTKLLPSLYRSLLKTAKGYDESPWKRACLIHDPFLRSLFQAGGRKSRRSARRKAWITFCLGDRSCQDVVKRAFRYRRPDADSSVNVISAFKALRHLNNHMPPVLSSSGVPSTKYTALKLLMLATRVQTGLTDNPLAPPPPRSPPLAPLSSSTLEFSDPSSHAKFPESSVDPISDPTPAPATPWANEYPQTVNEYDQPNVFSASSAQSSSQSVGSSTMSETGADPASQAAAENEQMMALQALLTEIEESEEFHQQTESVWARKSLEIGEIPAGNLGSVHQGLLDQIIMTVGRGLTPDLLDPLITELTALPPDSLNVLPQLSGPALQALGMVLAADPAQTDIPLVYSVYNEVYGRGILDEVPLLLDEFAVASVRDPACPLAALSIFPSKSALSNSPEQQVAAVPSQAGQGGHVEAEESVELTDALNLLFGGQEDMKGSELASVTRKRQLLVSEVSELDPRQGGRAREGRDAAVEHDDTEKNVTKNTSQDLNLELDRIDVCLLSLACRRISIKLLWELYEHLYDLKFRQHLQVC